MHSQSDSHSAEEARLNTKGQPHHAVDDGDVCEYVVVHVCLLQKKPKRKIRPTLLECGFSFRAT